MPKYTVSDQFAIFHRGQTYNPGDEIELDSEELAQALLDKGQIEKSGKKSSSSSSPSPSPKSENGGDK